MDLLTSPSTFPEPLSNLSPEAIHEASLSVTRSQGFLSDSVELATFELALSLHVSSPKIEAFYQFYEDRRLDKLQPPRGYSDYECGSWVDWYGTKVCDADELTSILTRAGVEGNETWTP